MNDHNLVIVLYQHAQIRPSAIAIYQGSSKITFAQLVILMNRAANFFLSQNINQGDIIALSIQNNIDSLIAMLGILQIGATIYTIPIAASSLQRQEMLDWLSVKALITDQSIQQKITVPIISFNTKHHLKPQGFQNPKIYLKPKAPWLIITGSGSTGRPKKIPVSHAQFRVRARLATQALNIGPDDRISTLLSMEFAAGKTRYLEALFAGAAITLPDPQHINPITFCKHHSITILYASVFHVEKILEALPEKSKNALDGLKALHINASTVSDRLRLSIIKKLTNQLYIRYGSNETGIITISKPHEVIGLSNTVGHPVNEIYLQIVSNDGEVMPQGEIGLIRVKGAGVFDGYLHDLEATQRVLKSNWFYPGDIGYLSHDGQLVYQGRADQMMIFNGINIYPTEIESTVIKHEAVMDAVAIPIRHPTYQEIPICFVNLYPGHQVNENILIQYCIERLGSRGPKRVFIIDKIPRNEQGKLIRSQLNHHIKSMIENNGEA
jgi:acyl-coenzyme A synthetase/AMP-(fatty) acid ligase